MKVFIVLLAVINVAVSRSAVDDFASVKLRAKTQIKTRSAFRDVAAVSNQVTPFLIEGYYPTLLDHFSPIESRVMQLNYQWHQEFFEEDGQIFVNIPVDEGTRWISSGLVYDLAKEMKGALVSADLRFIGKNEIPAKNWTENHLKYFTVDQIVADVGRMVSFMRLNFESPKSKVILFGSRLGGTIATLARKKFPHLIDGVWSSNGVFEAVVPDPHVFNSISRSIHEYGSAHCAKKVSSALNAIVSFSENKNRSRLNELFNLCDSIFFANDLDGVSIVEKLFHYIVEYIEKRQYNGIQELCRDMERGNDEVKAFARWVNYVYDDEDKCRDLSYNTYYARLGMKERALGYLNCMQTGQAFAVTSDNNKFNIFPNVINQTFHEKRCEDTYGVLFDRHRLERNVENFNIQNGGRVQLASNAIFTVSDMDVHRERGISEYDQYSSKVIITQMAGAGVDMESLSNADFFLLRDTKNEVLDALRVCAFAEENDEIKFVEI